MIKLKVIKKETQKKVTSIGNSKRSKPKNLRMLFNMEKARRLLETLRLPFEGKTSSIRRNNKNKTNVWFRISTSHGNTKRKT